MPLPVTRLAPSPTGALHLGNARTFLMNWLLARQLGWSIHLRIEDLDGPRIKRGADLQAMEDLAWLGLDWDSGPIYQSSRASLYRAAIDRLLADGLAYPCICSRSESLLAASAPHADDGAVCYPGTCRDRFTSIDQARNDCGKDPAIRFRVPDQIEIFHDQFSGEHRFNLQRLGDFVIAKSDGTPAYQLAVVVDDLEMHITKVVRGEDLLESTARQRLIYRALGRGDELPEYYHLPLIVGPDGRRLAKRHGDSRLSHYRAMGVPPNRILGLLARWCGVMRESDEVMLSELLDRFDLQFVPRTPIQYSSADEAALLAGARR